MTGPEETIAAIDAALDAWTGYDGSVSSDAMRWAPEPPEPCGDKPAMQGARPAFTVLDEASAILQDQQVVGLGRGRAYMWAGAEDGWCDVGGVVDVQFEPVPFAEVVAEFQRGIEQMRASFTAIFQSISVHTRSAHPSLALWIYGGRYRRHRRSCRLCNPNGNPPPLAVNGADYTRRRKARARRRR